MWPAARLAFAIAWACVCLASQPLPIGIFLDFANQPEAALVDLMKSEIREILAPAQLRLSFQRLGESGASQPFRKIVVIRFQGSCHTQADSGNIQLDEPGILDSPALGRTNVASGRILPYVKIFCNEVRAFVPAVSSISYARMYGRALGRVVAHELYHALLSTRAHSKTGVAQSAQTAHDLTREKLALDARSISLLRDLYGPKEKEGDSLEPPSDPERHLIVPVSQSGASQ